MFFNCCINDRHGLATNNKTKNNESYDLFGELVSGVDKTSQISQGNIAVAVIKRPRQSILSEILAVLSSFHSSSYIQRCHFAIKTPMSMSAVSKKPCRLTVASPNNNAEELFIEVAASIQDGRNFRSMYGCAICWVTVGVVCLINVLAFTGAGVGAFAVFLICIALAILYQNAWQEDGPNMKTDGSGVSMPRLNLADKVEERVRKEMEQYQTSFRDLQPRAKAPQVFNGSNETLREIMADTFPAYESMNYAGCVPESALVSYALAWPLLYDKYKGHRRAELLKELHEKWLELIGISLEWAGHILKDVDQQRIKARRRALNTVIGHDVEEAVTDSQGPLRPGGAPSGGASYEGRLRSRLDYFKASLQDMRQVNRDDHDFNMKLNFAVLPERTGLHEISFQRCLFVGGFIAAICMQGVFIMAVAGSAAGALGVLGGAALASGIYMFVSVRKANNGFNTLEYLCNVEQLVRKALVSEIEQSKIEGEEDLTDMTNQLRNTIMEAYYDTLSIHLETELITYGMVPPTPEYDPTPLFGIEDKTINEEVEGI